MYNHMYNHTWAHKPLSTAEHESGTACKASGWASCPLSIVCLARSQKLIFLFYSLFSLFFWCDNLNATYFLAPSNNMHKRWSTVCRCIEIDLLNSWCTPQILCMACSVLLTEIPQGLMHSVSSREEPDSQHTGESANHNYSSSNEAYYSPAHHPAQQKALSAPITLMLAPSRSC